MKHSIKAKLSNIKITEKHLQVAFMFLPVIFLLMPHLSYAEDLFSSSKQTINDTTVSDDSSIHTILIVISIIVSAITGAMTHDWVKGIASFFVFNMFWMVATSMMPA